MLREVSPGLQNLIIDLFSTFLQQDRLRTLCAQALLWIVVLAIQKTVVQMIVRSRPLRGSTCVVQTQETYLSAVPHLEARRHTVRG